MISYFKYTDGTSFTLDGVPYRGMFINTQTGIYTGSILTNDSKKLSGNNNFLSQVYDYKYDFNFTYKTPLTASYNTAKAYPRTILSYEHLTEVLNEVNKNNLLLYSRMFKYSDDIFNVFAKTQDNASITYCLTSQGDSFTSKQQPTTRLPLNTDHRFYNTHKSLHRSSFFVTLSTKDIFNYYNTNDVKLSGSISSFGVPLSTTMSTLSSGTIYFDKYNNHAYHVVGTKYNLYYYDYSAECGEFGLLNIVDISLNLTSKYKIENVTFGRRYRCAILESGDNTIIEISGVGEVEQLCSIRASDIDITTVISTCQRFEDDAYAILYLRDGTVRLRVYDLSQVVSRLRSNRPQVETYNYLKQSAVYDNIVRGGIGLSHRIEFAPFDSDVVIFKLFLNNSLTEVEFRSISNPQYSITVFNGYTRMGYVSEPTSMLNDITISLDTIITTFDNYNQPQPIQIYDMQFDVQDTVRYLVIYKDSVEVQAISNLFKSCITSNLTKIYSLLPDPSNSSVGAVLNNNLHNIIYDTFTLYRNIMSSFAYERASGRYIGQSPLRLPRVRDLDLYIYENESINIGVIDRIFTTLFTMQENIIRTIT